MKVFTESLQHHLRNLPGCRVEARLFVPGFVYTQLTANGRTEKPAGAWTQEQAVDFLFHALDRDEFYILCPTMTLTVHWMQSASSGPQAILRKIARRCHDGIQIMPRPSRTG